MKLERNRAERRNKHGVSILYNGVPYLIFAALAAGFLLGAPQQAATSAIMQSDKSTVSVVECKYLPFAFAGYLGKTNSVLSRGFTEDDFTFTGSKTWVDDGDGNWRLKFLSSGTFTPKKKVIIDVFIVGGGGGGGSGSGGGGASGYTGTYKCITLAANTGYAIVIGSGGASGVSSGTGGTGGTSSAFSYSKSGGLGGQGYNTGRKGGNGGSGGGGANTGVGGTNGSNGGSSQYFAGGTGQLTSTREFGDTTGALYAGGGGASQAAGGIGGGGTGGGSNGTGISGTSNTGGGGGCSGENAAYIGGAGGSGIVVIRNAR